MIFIATIVLLFVTRLRWPPDKSIKDIIHQRYDESVLYTFRNLERLEFKVKKLKADLSFLRTCSEYDLIPNFLYFKMYDERVKSSNVYREAQKMFLQNEIRHKVKELSRLDSKRIKLKSDLRVTTSFFDYTHLTNLIEVSTTGKIGLYR